MKASDGPVGGGGTPLPQPCSAPASLSPLAQQSLPLHQQQRQLLDLLPVAVYACEAPAGRITFYNKQAAILWGRQPEIGDSDQRFCGSFRLWRIDGSLLPHDRTPMAFAVREGRSFRNEEVIIERPDGSRIHVLVNIDAIRDDVGRIVGAINSFHDVTALKSAEAAWRESEQRLRLALEAGRMGTWEWNIRSNQVLWSPGLESIHGLAPGSFAGTFEAYRQDIHPEDREHVERAIRATLQNGHEHHIEYRIVWQDGSVHWVEGRGKLFRDESGAPLRLTGVCTDITERKLAEDSLRRTQEELRTADRRKDEFLATLAHELRNPLAPLANGLRILRSVANDPEQVRHCLEMMDRQFSQLVRLVDDLMEVSRITQGKIALRKQRVSVAEILQQAVETSRPLIGQRGHELLIETPEQPLVLEADAVRLAQVLSNLLNNAAKYTPPGGWIQVKAGHCDGEAVLSVQDNGSGIEPHVLPRIFDLFSQGVHSANPESGGLGIGLMLVKQLVEMHGGTVTAHSDGSGTGSRFVVRLPLAGEPAILERPALAADEGSQPSGVWMPADCGISTGRQVANAGSAAGRQAAVPDA